MHRHPPACPAPLAWCAMLLAAAGALPAGGQSDPPVPVTVESNSVPRAVTLFRGRASVTRPMQLDVQRGVYELVFSSLPETVDPGTLQVRISGPARVLGVDYEERPAGASAGERTAEVTARIDAVKLELREAGDERTLIRAREQFIDAVSVRATSDATADGGTGGLDLARVREQYEFVAEARGELILAHRALELRERDLRQRLEGLEAEQAQIAGRSPVERTGVVTLVANGAGRINIDFIYLVTDAEWVPVYSIRAAASGASVTIEYEAVLRQSTGENWEEVDLTLSTAQPSLAANPPELQPWYLDVREPGSGLRGVVEGGFVTPEMRDADLEALRGDAALGGGATSVTFPLPRQVTVPSRAARQRRTRIAEIAARPEFFHVAVPALTDAVYIRGELVNTGAYHLLPGRASIFIGQDFIGPSWLGSVAPGGRFDLYFGIDRTVRASRLTVNKRTSKTGLLGGGRKTSYDYRIEVENGKGKPIEMELWDRVPVSRSEEIEVQLVNLSWPLASDLDYVEEDRPRGLLKWRLTIPPRTATRPEPFSLSYGLRVTRSKEVEISPLP